MVTEQQLENVVECGRCGGRIDRNIDAVIHKHGEYYHTKFEDCMEVSLVFLSESAEDHARWKAATKVAENRVRVVEGKHFLEAEGNIEQRKAIARQTEEYQNELDKQEEAWYEYELVHAKRVNAEAIVEIWRTESANRRAANVS